MRVRIQKRFLSPGRLVLAPRLGAVLAGAVLAGAVLAICTAAFCSLSPEPAYAGTDSSADGIDMVLASVDGEPLTMSDLKHFIESHGEAAPQDLLDGSPETRKMLRELVIEELIAREANSSGISVSKDEIDAYIEEIKRQNNVDSDGFNSLLASKGLNPETYQKQVRSDILRTRILGSKVRPKINILDDDIKKYFEQHPELKPKSGEQRVEEILFTAPGKPKAKDALDEKEGDAGEAADGESAKSQDDDELRERAEKAAEKVKDGKSMKEIGGDSYTDLGYVDADDLKPELREIAKKLKPGEVSGAEAVANGYVVLRVSAPTEEDKIDEDVKNQIRRELFEKEFKEAADKYLNEELPKKYHVELKL